MPDDLELGAKQLAYTATFDSDAGNGEERLRLRGLVSGREQTLDTGVIGEGNSTGFNGLTFLGNALFWQRASRAACSVKIAGFRKYDVRAGRTGEVVTGTAPVALRRRLPAAPDTPESEGCDSG